MRQKLASFPAPSDATWWPPFPSLSFWLSVRWTSDLEKGSTWCQGCVQPADTKKSLSSAATTRRPLSPPMRLCNGRPAAETTRAWSTSSAGSAAFLSFFLSVFFFYFYFFNNQRLRSLSPPQLDIVQQEYIHEAGLSQFEVVRAALDGPGDWLATVEQRQQKDAELELNLKLWAFDQQTQRCGPLVQRPPTPHSHPTPRPHPALCASRQSGSIAWRHLYCF